MPTKKNWTDFGDDAEAIAQKPKAECGIKKLLDSLPAHGKRAVEGAFARKELTHASLALALKVRLGDKAPNAFTISRHRRGLCQCERR